jgi:hypothetical protein
LAKTISKNYNNNMKHPCSPFGGWGLLKKTIMKKIIFLFAMLASMAASAQNVQIESISATYTASPVIKFKVSWTGARTYRHNTKVWVFVDYRKVENNAPVGNWTRATVTSTPTVNPTPTSTATLVAGNNKGFWLNGADGDYSATVTVPLMVATGVAQFNWCAYATDYPPNVVIHSTSSYTLRGSRPFVVNDETLPVNQITYSGTIYSFTDATGAPGLFPAALNEQTNGMGCVAGLVENQSGVCVSPSAAKCNNNSLNLGTVSFAPGAEVQIIGNGISQIWSRPVTATNCQKTTFDGGSYTSSYNADCRSNPGYAGDLLSGCAIIRYAATLCPPPWRVPVQADMLNLVVAMGGNSGNVADENFVVNQLMGTWGAEWNGMCWWKGEIEYQEQFGIYGYSQYWYKEIQGIDIGEDRKFGRLYVGGGILLPVLGETVIWRYNPRGSHCMECGLELRCVKD